MMQSGHNMSCLIIHGWKTRSTIAPLSLLHSVSQSFAMGSMSGAWNTEFLVVANWKNVAT